MFLLTSPGALIPYAFSGVRCCYNVPDHQNLSQLDGEECSCSTQRCLSLIWFNIPDRQTSKYVLCHSPSLNNAATLLFIYLVSLICLGYLYSPFSAEAELRYVNCPFSVEADLRYLKCPFCAEYLLDLRHLNCPFSAEADLRYVNCPFSVEADFRCLNCPF